MTRRTIPFVVVGWALMAVGAVAVDQTRLERDLKEAAEGILDEAAASAGGLHEWRRAPSDALPGAQ